MRLAWPLTGRLEELQAIEAAIADPDVSGIVVFGAAGVGKSRIVREALSSAAAGGREIRWAAATASARTLPLGALTQWIPNDATDDLALVRGVIEGLTAQSDGSAAAIVGVDDGHLLDNLSVFVLHQIVQRRAAKVVVTLRDGESIPAGLSAIWSSGQFERVDLLPLSENDTGRLASSALGGKLEPVAAQQLWRLTRGNPLYLSNIVDHEVRHQRLTLERGYWTWHGEPSVPPNLAEMIEERIGALPAAVSDVLDVLAVGEPLTLASLANIADPDAVEQAEVRGLIALAEVDGRMEVRLAHPLYGEVRGKRAAATRLRRLRGIVATELAAGADRDDMRIIVRRATLTLESDLAPEANLLVMAAQGATLLADLPLADRLAAAAIRAGAGVDAYAVRAHALGWLNRARDAEAAFADCPTEGWSETDRAMLAFLRANNMHWGLADPEGAKAFIEDVSAHIGPEGRVFVDAFLAIYWATAAKPVNSIERSKAIVLQKLPHVARSETVSAVVGALGAVGCIDDAIALADEELDRLTRSFNAHYMRSIIIERLIAGLLLAGRIHEALEAADELRRQAVDLPGHAQSVSAATMGRADLCGGRLVDAHSLIEPVVQMFAASGNTNDIWYHCQPRFTTTLAMLGRTEQAVNALNDLESNRHPTRRFLDYEGALARAWVAAAQGIVSEAIETALSAAAAANENGEFAVEVLCLQTATQFGDHTAHSRLRELAAVVEGPRAGIALRFAAALAAEDASELASVSMEFEGIEDMVAAVDAAAYAAMAYRREDRKGTALTCSSRATELARRCGGANTPALRRASERVPLTDREREIVTMIGQGFSNRVIAERLTLSVRTVEGHIYRAMTKTGAIDRAELARMLPRVAVQ